jgi:hypothetical protein
MSGVVLLTLLVLASLILVVGLFRTASPYADAVLRDPFSIYLRSSLRASNFRSLASGDRHECGTTPSRSRNRFCSSRLTEALYPLPMFFISVHSKGSLRMIVKCTLALAVAGLLICIVVFVAPLPILQVFIDHKAKGCFVSPSENVLIPYAPIYVRDDSAVLGCGQKRLCKWTCVKRIRLPR